MPEPGFPAQRWRAAFPALRRGPGAGPPIAHLDGPGGSQVPHVVLDAMLRYLVEENANTGGAFAKSQATDRMLRQSRAALADLFGAPSGASVAFGANMTSLAFALARAVGRDLHDGDEVVVTELDHDANVAPWLRLAERGAVVRTAQLRPDTGELDLDHLRSLLGPRTRLVAVGWASNALGTVNPVAEICAAAHAVGAWCVVDAVHWAPHGPMDVLAVGADFCLVSAYKFFGPHVGALYGAPDAFARLRPDRVRGQAAEPPECLETGTLNHEGIAGAMAAVEFIADMAPAGTEGSRRSRIVASMTAVERYEHGLAGRLWRSLDAIPGVRLFGPPVADAPRAPTVAFTVRDLPARRVTAALAERGLQLWDGDFYALGVVERLGLAHRGGLVRAGISPYTERGEVDRLAQAVEDLARS
jgi:cysteine desulfurase family protein (TIGR01976 family)